MIRKATCCCGNLTITVKGEPGVQGICHCDDCKKRTGSAFGWSAYFANDQVIEKSGETGSYHLGGAYPQERFFCRNCGSTLFWTSAALAEMTGIAAGCFVAQPLPGPGYTLSGEGRCGWVTLPEDWKTSL